MALNTLVPGKPEKRMEKAALLDQMAANKTDNGSMGGFTAEGSVCGPMGVSMMGSGKTERNMELAYLLLLMDTSIRGSGKKIGRMAEV